MLRIQMEEFEHPETGRAAIRTRHVYTVPDSVAAHIDFIGDVIRFPKVKKQRVEPFQVSDSPQLMKKSLESSAAAADPTSPYLFGTKFSRLFHFNTVLFLNDQPHTGVAPLRFFSPLDRNAKITTLRFSQLPALGFPCVKVRAKASLLSRWVPKRRAIKTLFCKLFPSIPATARHVLLSALCVPTTRQCQVSLIPPPSAR